MAEPVVSTKSIDYIDVVERDDVGANENNTDEPLEDELIDTLVVDVSRLLVSWDKETLSILNEETPEACYRALHRLLADDKFNKYVSEFNEVHSNMIQSFCSKKTIHIYVQNQNTRFLINSTTRMISIVEQERHLLDRILERCGENIDSPKDVSPIDVDEAGASLNGPQSEEFLDVVKYFGQYSAEFLKAHMTFSEEIHKLEGQNVSHFELIQYMKEFRNKTDEYIQILRQELQSWEKMLGIHTITLSKTASNIILVIVGLIALGIISLMVMFFIEIVTHG